MTAMSAATVAAASMTAAMMITANIGIIFQSISQKAFHRCVRITPDTAKQPDTGICQCHLCSTANTAANHHIYLQCSQQPRQCSMPPAVNIHHFFQHNLPVFHGVELKLPGMPKVLKNFSICISYRNSHVFYSFV